MVGWLRNLNETNPRAFDKCRAAISRLALLGHELRRPEADYLRMTFMSYGFDWDRLITASFTSFMGEPFQLSPMA